MTPDKKKRIFEGTAGGTVSGSLKNCGFADILIELQRGRKSGTLEIRDGHSIKRIQIRDGDIIFAVSNKEQDGLLETLLRSGNISDDQYYQVINLSGKTGRNHGSTLVEIGALKPQDLVWAVRNQMEEIVLSIFQWESADFTFLEGQSALEKIVEIKLNTSDLIYRGIKGIKNPTLLEESMPSADALIERAADFSERGEDIRLDEPEIKVLSLVDGKTTLSEILHSSSPDTLRSMKAVYALFSLGIIRLKGEGTAKGEAGEPESSIDAEFLERVDDIEKKIDSGDYYSLLGIEKKATLDQIKKSYYNLAKDFHPDKHLSIPSKILKDRLNSVFSHLTSAYKLLSDTGKRIEYDRSVPESDHVRTSGVAEDKTDNVSLAKLRFLEGEKAFKSGSYTKARELFGQAVYLNGSAHAYHFHLGLALMKEKNFREAGKVLTTALKLSPANAVYMSELGHVYTELGFNLRAKSLFEKALAVDPDNKRAADGLRSLEQR